MIETDNFSEKESLQLISEMIGKAKKSYIEKGIASMVWGSLIVFCSLVNWSQVKYNHQWPIADIWILTLVALIPQIFFSVKESRSKKYVSYEQTILKYTWIAFGISIFILSFYMNKQTQGGQSSTLFMMLYGIPTFITGGTTKFKPMIYGGLFCWASSFIAIYTNIEVDLLLMAASGLFAWLIPGIILWTRYKKIIAASV
ncbi:MAG: hypothetical protein LH615_09285 [Ferruginibacter sp.]|nr:hypothetical protein [Ferruginibacter sp.]